MRMKLDPEASVFVSIGASPAANCTTCLEKTVNMAKTLGAAEEQIGAAVQIGKRVRDGATAKLDPFALTSRYQAFEVSHLLSM